MPTQTNKDYEENILELMLKTFHFERLNNKWFKCRLCGKRFMKNYIGIPLNERMIQHFERYHK